MFLAEQIDDIGASLEMLLALKKLWDHGYDVSNFHYWYQSGYVYPDDIIFRIVTEVFEIHPDLVEDDVSGDYDVGFSAVVPVIQKLREWEATPFNQKGEVSRFLQWIENAMNDTFEKCFFDAWSFELTNDGFLLDYYTFGSPAYELVDPVVRIKRKIDRYLKSLERRKEHGSPAHRTDGTQLPEADS